MKIDLPKKVIDLIDVTNIKPLSSSKLFNGKESLPEDGGVYCFWWLGDREVLLNSNRTIKLQGPSKRLIKTEYHNSFPTELKYIPIYVGKTTNLKNRVSGHIMSGIKGRAHDKPVDNIWKRPRTTSCQVRAGIDFIFPNEKDTLDIIKNNVGISFLKVHSDDNVSERFYLEDFMIGYLRPWFNLDSER